MRETNFVCVLEKLAGSKGPILFPEHTQCIADVLEHAQKLQKNEENVRKSPASVECMAILGKLYRAVVPPSLVEIVQHNNNQIKKSYGSRLVVIPSPKSDGTQQHCFR